MIPTIIIVGLMFLYLGYETKWFTIHMLVGGLAKPKYARYRVYHNLKRCTGGWDSERGNLPEDFSPNGEPIYDLLLNPGIDNVLCGWEWLDKHCADLVDYKPEVSMRIGGVRYQMTIKQPSIIKDIMRVNKLTKKERLALA